MGAGNEPGRPPIEMIELEAQKRQEAQTRTKQHPLSPGRRFSWRWGHPPVSRNPTGSHNVRLMPVLLRRGDLQGHASAYHREEHHDYRNEDKRNKFHSGILLAPPEMMG